MDGPALDARNSRLLHTMLRVFDLDKSIDFYTRLMGMKLLRKRETAEGRYTLAFVGYGGEEDSTVLELTYNWDQKEPYAIGTAFGHLAVSAPDIYQVCERLAKEGVKITAPARAAQIRHHAHRLHRGSGRLQDRADPARLRPFFFASQNAIALDFGRQPCRADFRGFARRRGPCAAPDARSQEN